MNTQSQQSPAFASGKTQQSWRTSALGRFLGLDRWNPQQQSVGYLFLLPSLLGFTAFVLLPAIGSLGLSFFEWKLTNTPTFVGFDNYVELFTRDAVFPIVLGNTVFYVFAIVPLQLIIGLLMAVALNTGLKGLGIYRLIYFMPVVTNVVAAAMVFQWLFNQDFGLISSWIWQLADATGWNIQPPNWLTDPFWAKPTVAALTIWKNVGFTMVIYLSGLQNIPEVLYEAAEVDGASAWQKFRRITVPLVSPTTFFLLIMQMIGAFQLFAEPFVMTRVGGGEPLQATLSIVYYIYQNAFSYQKMGSAAAISWVLFGVIFVITVFQLRFQRRWVHYEVDES
ncbi:sugar ABC transporter permease [Phototrophicus methaneseepsis]|uniref:Sugar ABC transporter permease n=1 Tax=Phototrophicus methaneseepsis TaxID=2710758 RepID=A0A7S8IGM3_9CHLR|nr:sugar ABC transporter permease [Phototrophicus methaneseepsis]QPC84946.1 sugar ABC transporter permease [Phototrophicus methaneseepsis]